MAQNIKINVSVDTNQGLTNVEKLSQGFKKLNTNTKEANNTNKEFEKSLLKLVKNFGEINFHISQSFKNYADMFSTLKDFSGSFIEASKAMQTAKTQLAFITATTHSNISTTGQAISSLQKWQLAIKDSEKTFKEFNDLHTKTGYSLQELSSIFSSFSSTALNNMSFDEAKKAFESLMIAISNTSMSVNQLSMTMDSLGAGAFSASGDLRRFAESLGITNDAMAEAKQKGKLYELIIEKTKELTKYTDYTTQTYEKQMQKFEANIQSLKAELAEPFFDALKDSLVAFNEFVRDNEKEIKEWIKTFQSVMPVLLNFGVAFVALKTYSKIAPLLSKGFLELKSSIIQTSNALYQQKITSLSATQSINEINKKTLLLKSSFQGLASVAKGAIPLVFLDRILNLNSAIEKATQKTDKLTNSFKNKLEIYDKDELEKLKKDYEKEIENIQNLGSLNNSFGNFLSEWTFDFVGQAYKKASSGILSLGESIGLVREQGVKDIALMANAMQKLQAINEKLENTDKKELKLQNIQKLNKELSDAVSLVSSLKAPEFESDKIEKTTQALDKLKNKLLELVSIENWQDKSEYVEQINIISNALSNAQNYEQANKRLENEKKALEAKEKYIALLKEQNEALKEISQIGLSQYDKSLNEINEKLKEWQRLRLDKNTISKAYESLKIELDLSQANNEFSEAKSLMLEFYESVGDKQEAWALKEFELRERFSEILNQGLISEDDFKKLIKANKDAYFQVEKDSKEAMDETRKYYEKIIANMQKTIESSFFDVINGKIKTLKDLFKDLGKTILQDFLSPYISSLSGFLSRGGGGVLGLLTPNFANSSLINSSTNKESLISEFVSTQGLKLNDDGKYQGVINGVNVLMDKNGNIEQGKEALNNVSNIIDGASKLNNIMNTNWLEKADSVLNGKWLENGNLIDKINPNSILNTMKDYVNSIGMFGSNLLANTSAFVSNFLGLGASFSNGASLAGMGLSGASNAFSLGFSGGLGYIGGTLANAGVGGLLGYGIGSLGDLLFKADTHAGTGGAIGGALGSIIMPGIGTLVGGLLGSVIGGIFGKTKVTGSGLKLSENISFNDFFDTSNLKGYTDYKKKGWFSSKSWTNYTNLSDKKIQEINRVLENQYQTLIRLNANLDKFELSAGKYANNSLFDEALPTALLTSFLNDTSTIKEQINAIKEKAKENNITYAEQLSNQFGTFMQMQTSILSKMYQNDPAKVAKLSLDDAMYALKTSMRNVTGGFSLFGLSENSFTSLAKLSVEQFNKAFNESLRQDFSPENLELWQNLSDAFNEAQTALNSLLSAVISKTGELMSINQNFLSANGISSSVFEINNLLNSYASIMQVLNDDLNANEKAMLSDIFSANDKLLSLGYEGLNNFLSTGNTELRKQLVEILTQFQQVNQNQNGLIFSTTSLSALAEVEKLINAYEKNDGSDENKQVKLNENNKLLSKLNSELSILSSLGNFSENLINQSISTSKSVALNYDKVLKQAKNDFKNGNLTSSSFANLQSIATKKADDLKNTASSFEAYQFEMLKMADELKDLGGEADLNSLQSEIQKLTSENEKLQEQLNQTIKDTSSMTLAELKEYKQSLITQSEEEIKKIVEYLGEQSPISKYLKEMLGSIKDGASLTQSTINSLKYALLQYQNNQSEINKEFNQNITNPYKKTRAFADGGIVTSPTNALIGENGYAEAVIPLKDGKGLKIDTSGVFEKISLAFEKAINKGFSSINERLENIAFKVENVDKSVKRANMDLSILTRQTREILENI